TTVQREINSAGVPSGTPPKQEPPHDASHSSENRSEGVDCTENDFSVLRRDGKQYSRPKPLPAQNDDSDSVHHESHEPNENEPTYQIDVESVLDSPATEVGITPLDMNEMRSQREARTKKLIKAFNNRD